MKEKKMGVSSLKYMALTRGNYAKEFKVNHAFFSLGDFSTAGHVF